MRRQRVPTTRLCCNVSAIMVLLQMSILVVKCALVSALIVQPRAGTVAPVDDSARVPQFAKSSCGSCGSFAFRDEFLTWLQKECIPHEPLMLPLDDYATPLFPPGPIYLIGDPETTNLAVHLLATPQQSPLFEHSKVDEASKINEKLPDDNPSRWSAVLTGDFLDYQWIHLHQDIWSSEDKKDIVKARLLAKSLQRVSRRHFARKTVVRRIDAPTGATFLHQHHLWGATRAKYTYGLFSKATQELVAVATFSPRRHVMRCGQKFRSHELIRYCACRDEHVVGGITKLLAAFCRDVAPDDIVTCIDRDWGRGDGWHSLGFETVQLMPPLVMAIDKQPNIETDEKIIINRRHLVGAGVTPASSDVQKSPSVFTRPTLSEDIWEDLGNCCLEGELSGADDATKELTALTCLDRHGLAPVYDAGVERLILVIRGSKLEPHVELKRVELGLSPYDKEHLYSAHELWQQSVPTFPNEYYSVSVGVNALLNGARRAFVNKTNNVPANP
uniref:Uncharacterized protein n=1 Tax=Attheya septentrionalis TaxID=420275 RepID=A0A7S2XP92_9STRA|mmetsp:Transcript_24675/g.44660  ORF Transcript_24675/g.44660 Transcript_24675/m.44660 type:complete len:501 (+) Transcript_24675:198-1700(+)